MATIAINGTTLQPQPMEDSWSDAIVSGKLDGTDSIGAYKIFTMRCPALAGQVFNWDQFENQVLTSLTAYEPGDLPTSADVIFNSGVVSRKISRYNSPLNRSVTEVELIIQVVISDDGS